jgi:hypothetical protein
MKRLQLRHLLIYLVLLQFIAPIPTLVWGELVGVLGGALASAALTPLVALALSRLQRHLLRRIEEQVARFSFTAPGATAGERWALPMLQVIGTGLTRSLGPVSFLLLLVCLSGILPVLGYMLLDFFEILYVLVILGVVALVLLGQAHPELLQMLLHMLFRRRQRDNRPHGRVIIVAATTDEQAAAPPLPLQSRPADGRSRGRLPGVGSRLLLPTPSEGSDGRGRPPREQDPERE